MVIIAALQESHDTTLHQRIAAHCMVYAQLAKEDVRYKIENAIGVLLNIHFDPLQFFVEASVSERAHLEDQEAILWLSRWLRNEEEENMDDNFTVHFSAKLCHPPGNFVLQFV